MAAIARKDVGIDVATSIEAVADRLEKGGTNPGAAASGAERSDGVEANVASQEYVNSVRSAHRSGGRSQGPAASGEATRPTGSSASPQNLVRVDHDRLANLIDSISATTKNSHDGEPSVAAGQVFTSYA